MNIVELISVRNLGHEYYGVRFDVSGSTDEFGQVTKTIKWCKRLFGSVKNYSMPDMIIDSTCDTYLGKDWYVDSGEYHYSDNTGIIGAYFLSRSDRAEFILSYPVDGTIE